MTIRVITACLSGTHADNAVLNASLAIAKLAGGHIDAVLAHPNPVYTALAGEEAIYSSMYQDIVAQMRKRCSLVAEKTRKAFDKWRQENKVSIGHMPSADGAPTATWREAAGLDEETLGHAGRIVDLTVAGLPSRKMEKPSGALFEAVLFDAKRPVLLIPPGNDIDPTEGTVVIAWNGSAEAAHAVFAALPFLSRFSEVLVMTAEDGDISEGTASPLIEYLQWHAIEAKPVNVKVKEDYRAEESLLNAVKAAKANLLIMGAFTHSRMREAIFGGVTRYVFRNAKVPVLMAH